MLTLLIIGITIAIIGGLRGAARFVPIIAPIWLPVSIAVTMAFGEQTSLVVSGSRRHHRLVPDRLRHLPGRRLHLGSVVEIGIPRVIDSRRRRVGKWRGCAMELTEAVKALLQEAARALKGGERRRFLARTVQELGPGGQRRAARELGWSRVTIRKGGRELARGMTCVDAFALRGRKGAEAQLPNLLADLRRLPIASAKPIPPFARPASIRG